MFSFILGSIGVAWTVAILSMSADQVRRFVAFFGFLTAIVVMFSDPSSPPGSLAVLLLFVFALLDIGDRYVKNIEAVKKK